MADIVMITKTILDHLSPSDQAVYLRLWNWTHAIGQIQCRARFADIADEANVSRNTGKTAILRLEERRLVEIERQPKAPSRFTVHTTPLDSDVQVVKLGTISRVLEVLEDEDRSTFLEMKQ